jgi:hypothetical protein
MFLHAAHILYVCTQELRQGIRSVRNCNVDSNVDYKIIRKKQGISPWLRSDYLKFYTGSTRDIPLHANFWPVDTEYQNKNEKGDGYKFP